MERAKQHKSPGKMRRKREPAAPGKSRDRALAAAEETRRITTLLQTRIKQQGFTQKGVQEILGWGKSYVSELLHGKVSLRVEHLLLICDVIGVSPEEFFALPSEDSRDSVSEKDLDELLKSYGHPMQVLGSVDEAGLLQAAQRRLPQTRGAKRRYLTDLVTWCENSIELDKRTAERRKKARTRKGGELPPASPTETRLKWPDFEAYKR